MTELGAMNLVDEERQGADHAVYPMDLVEDRRRKVGVATGEDQQDDVEFVHQRGSGNADR